MPEASKKAREDLEFHALRNALYHTARRNALEMRGRWLSFLVIIGGASAAANLFSTLGVTPWVGFGIAIIGALQLVFNFAGTARVHELLQKRYYDLLGRIKDNPAMTEDDCNKLMGELVRISGEEPPIYRTVDAIAHNEATDSLYGDDRNEHKLVVKKWHNFTKHLFHHNGVTYEYVGTKAKVGK